MKKYTAELSRKPEVREKISRGRKGKLDQVVLEAWSEKDVENSLPLTVQEIHDRSRIYASPERVEKQMDLYAFLVGNFEIVEKNGEKAYRPNTESPYACMLDGIWKKPLEPDGPGI